MIERCGDRQRKCDGLKKWPLHFFIESLPVMLQAALFLLACGLCRHMWSINTSVAYTLVGLTGLGATFYITIVIAGTSSYACPFQTPVSTALRDPWKRVRRGAISSGVHSKRALLHIQWLWDWRVWPPLRRPPLPITTPLRNAQVHEPGPLLKPEDLAIIRRTNANDVGCVSWILWNITDPEALDAAIRLAGTIRWFEDRINADIPYDLIVSTFGACFDPAGKLYPGSRDRAYYSGRAMVWIHTLAMSKSEEFALRFLLPRAKYEEPGLDRDLRHLLRINRGLYFGDRHVAELLVIDPEHTPSHAQWISDVLLCHSWGTRSKPNYGAIPHWIPNAHETRITTPLNTTLNHLLVWCIFLGSPPMEEALRVQNKSYGISWFALQIAHSTLPSDCLEQILGQLSKAVLLAINGNWHQCRFIRCVLRDLAKLEVQPACLTAFAYEWCSAIYENREHFEDWESLLLVCLELGFRHLDDQRPSTNIRLTHTEHHQALVDIIFKSQKGDAIADLLHAWTLGRHFSGPAGALVDVCTEHFVGLHNLVPFSPRLRRLVIRFIERVGYKAFEGAGAERFTELLDYLHVTIEDTDLKVRWTSLLLDVIRSSEGTLRLSHWYWELLVEMVVLTPWWLRFEVTYCLEIIESLMESREWGKLECWIGIVWMFSGSPGAVGVTEEDLEDSMLLLFHQRPGAAQKLEQRMKQWSQRRKENILELFQRTFTRTREAVRRQVAL